MPVKPWFPTYIYEAPLQGKGNDAVAHSLLQECHKVREQDSAGRLWCQENYPAGYTSYGTLRTLNRTYSKFPAFISLERKIWRHVQRFARQLDMDLSDVHLAMTDCWVNVMSHGAVHPLHLHPGAVLSGSYYVSTPPGCSGIRFEDPRMDKLKGGPPRLANCQAGNRQQVSCEAKAGKLIMFESWLRHEVPSNASTEERVSISFNYTWV